MNSLSYIPVLRTGIVDPKDQRTPQIQVLAAEGQSGNSQCWKAGGAREGLVWCTGVVLHSFSFQNQDFKTPIVKKELTDRGKSLD